MNINFEVHGVKTQVVDVDSGHCYGYYKILGGYLYAQFANSKDMWFETGAARQAQQWFLKEIGLESVYKQNIKS